MVGVRVGEGNALVTTTLLAGVGVGETVVEAFEFVPTTRTLVGVGDGVSA